MGLDPKKAKEYAESTERAEKATIGLNKENKDLSKNLREILFLTRDYSEEARGATKAVFESSEQASAAATAFKKIANVTRDIKTEMDDVLAGALSYEQASKRVTQFEKAKKSLMTEQEAALDKILSNKVSEVEKERMINQAMTDNVGLAEVISEIREKLSENESYLLDLYQAEGEALSDMGGDVQEIADRAGNIDDAFGLAGGSAEGLNSVIKQVGGNKFSEMLGLEDAVGNTREFAAKITDGGKNAAQLGDKFKVAGNLAKNLGKNLTKSLGPYALIAMAIEQLVEAFKKIDKWSGEIAKSMAISVQEADKLVKHSNEAAAASGDLMLTTGDLVDAQMELNKHFGTSVTYSAEMATEWAQIKERTGLSAEALGTFADLAVLSGTSIKQQLADVTAMTMQLKAETGIMLNAQEIQEGMAKMSKVALLSTQRNTKEMANQVFQAKLLGLEQSKVESIAEGLLDFERSIEAEMHAELMLNKELNLEKARAAAMNNDFATVASEMRKMDIDALKFGEMNHMQQQAIADVFNMSKEDFADMLVNQEKLVQIQKLGFKDVSDAQQQYNDAVASGTMTEELRLKLQEAGLLNQFESVTRQDKLNAAIEKMQDLFVSLVTPLMPVLDIFIELAEQVLPPIVEAITPILSMMGELLSQILQPIAALLTGILKPIFEAMMVPVEIIKDAFDEVNEILSEIFPESEGLQNVFEIIGEVIGTIIAFGIEPMRMGIRFIAERVKALANIFGGIVKIFKGDFEEGFKQIAEGAIGFILAPFQALTDTVIGMINWIIKGINKIPGVSLSLLESPDLQGMVMDAIGLADGAIVTAPTTAVVGEGGEPEAVVPLSKAAEYGFGGGGGNNNETNNLLRQLIQLVKEGGNVYIDGSKVGKSLTLASSKIG